MAKIMIVEDNPAIISTVSDVLAKWQYELQTITDWQNVAKEIESARPDLFCLTLPCRALMVFIGCRKSGKLVPSQLS